MKIDSLIKLSKNYNLKIAEEYDFNKDFKDILEACQNVSELKYMIDQEPKVCCERNDEIIDYSLRKLEPLTQIYIISALIDKGAKIDYNKYLTSIVPLFDSELGVFYEDVLLDIFKYKVYDNKMLNIALQYKNGHYDALLRFTIEKSSIDTKRLQKTLIFYNFYREVIDLSADKPSEVDLQLTFDMIIKNDLQNNLDLHSSFRSFIKAIINYNIPLDFQILLVRNNIFVPTLCLNESLKIDEVLQSLDESHQFRNFLEGIKSFSKERLSNVINILMQKQNTEIIIWCLDYEEINKNLTFDQKALNAYFEKNAGIQEIKLLTKTNAPFINFASLKKRYNDLVIKVMFPAGGTTVAAMNYDLARIKTYTNDVENLKFANYLVEVKDLYYLDLTNFKKIVKNDLIAHYLKIKNKTYADLYNESFKKENTLEKIHKIDNKLTTYGEFSKEFNTLNITKLLVINSQNLNEYIKQLDRTLDICETMHDNGGDPEIYKKAILNKSFNTKDDSNEEFLSIINDISEYDEEGLRIKVSQTNISAKKQLIDLDRFMHNYEVLSAEITKFNNMQPISWQNGSQALISLKQFHTDLSIIENIETILKYIDRAKPKDPNLEKLNMSIGDYNFKVLGYLDPYTLKVGADTQCCQRMGGAAETCVIDSFINPFSGVVILTNNSTLISQSYFHYVPQDNGFILDNVESNKNNMKKLGLSENSLSKLYAGFAAKVKEMHPEVSYFKCGKAHNKLNDNLFESSSIKEDSRHYEYDDDDVYSDFDNSNHLDLLKPKNSINDIAVATKSANCEKIQYIIKSTVIRKIAINKITSKYEENKFNK